MRPTNKSSRPSNCCCSWRTTPATANFSTPSFRCAHTVKGSAGIFGLDRVVAFTHQVETLLDEVREGRVAVTPELSTLLLPSNDQIRTLVSNARAGRRKR